MLQDYMLLLCLEAIVAAVSSTSIAWSFEREFSSYQPGCRVRCSLEPSLRCSAHAAHDDHEAALTAAAAAGLAAVQTAHQAAQDIQ
jgi:hypothetical protein